MGIPFFGCKNWALTLPKIMPFSNEVYVRKEPPKKKAACYTGPYWTTPKRQRDSNEGLSLYWTSARPTVLVEEGTTKGNGATQKQIPPTASLTL